MASLKNSGRKKEKKDTPRTQGITKQRHFTITK